MKVFIGDLGWNYPYPTNHRGLNTEDVIMSVAGRHARGGRPFVSVVGLSVAEFDEMATRLDARVDDAVFAPVMLVLTSGGPVLVTLQEVLK